MALVFQILQGCYLEPSQPLSHCPAQMLKLPHSIQGPGHSRLTKLAWSPCSQEISVILRIWLGLASIWLFSSRKISLLTCVWRSCTRVHMLGKKSWDAPMMIKGFIAHIAPQLCKRGVKDMTSPQWFPVQSPAAFWTTDVVMRKG